jgi:flagellar basal body rod protein FlgG
MDATVSGLGTAASAMDAQSERLAVLANNLANVAAAGFKAEHLSFIQLLTSPRAAGSVPPTDPAAPLPCRPHSRTKTDFSSPARNAQVRQGVIEQSNVNPVLTLVEMVDAMRVYEAAQRAARGVDETLSHAVNDVARV